MTGSFPARSRSEIYWSGAALPFRVSCPGVAAVAVKKFYDRRGIFDGFPLRSYTVSRLFSRAGLLYRNIADPECFFRNAEVNRKGVCPWVLVN